MDAGIDLFPFTGHSDMDETPFTGHSDVDEAGVIAVVGGASVAEVDRPNQRLQTPGFVVETSAVTPPRTKTGQPDAAAGIAVESLPLGVMVPIFFA